MDHPKVIIEGESKHRDSKKWRLRWCVLSKLSPVADCLHLQLYRNSKERCKNGPTKASLSLEGFLGMETGFTLDKESNTIALICKDVVVLLAFDTREMLIQWQVKIRTHLPEEQHFLVQITHLPLKSKLSCGPSRLHLQDGAFSLVSGIPPRVIGHWPLKELRRFGAVDGKFCFEGGSLCGKGEGLHVLHTNQTDELERAFEMASKGKLHGKRKAMISKNQTIDGSSMRMSLQHSKCSHKSCECGSGSGESRRPLLSSGSESSMCDACSEIIRIGCSNGDNELSSDEAAYSRSTCCTTLRWSSNSSSIGGGAAYTSSASVTDENECFFTPSQSLTVLNNCVDSRRSVHGLSNNTDSNTLPRTQNDNRCSWIGDVCNKCGHYCLSSNGCSDDAASTRTVSNSTITTSLASSSDLRCISPALIDTHQHRHHHFRHYNGSVKKGSLPDRASLCSQSSQSSSNSNSSGSGNGSIGGGICSLCSSEYSVPRAVHHQQRADMHYDRPKDIPHNTCKLRSKSESSALCSCLITNNTDLILNTEGSLPKRVDFGNIITQTQSEIFADTDPKGISRKNSGNVHANCDITKCGCLSSNPMMHYAVPRTALAHIYLREMHKMQTDNTHSCALKRANSQSLMGQYDVPRKFKDVLNQKCQSPCICSVSSLPRQRTSSISSYENGTSDCNNGLMHGNSIVGGENVQYHASGMAIDQFSVCVCQKVDPFLKSCNCIQHSPITSQIVIGHKLEGNNSIIDTEIPECLTECISHGDERETLLIDDVIPQSNSIQSEQNQHNNYITIDCSHEKERQYATSHKHNYVNMHFVQSISFYENLKCRDGSITDQNSGKAAKAKGFIPVPSEEYQANDEQYEPMSFHDVSSSLSHESSDSNYLFMKPIFLKDKSINNDHETLDEQIIADAKHGIECVANSLKCIDKEHDGNKRCANGISSVKGIVNEFKRKMYRHRSHSIERRNNNNCRSPSSDRSSPSSCPSSPSMISIKNRKQMTGLNMTWKSKGKSLSIEDVSHTMASSPRFNRSLETLHSASFHRSFHRSADCLQLKVDNYRSSEEDLYTCSQITVLCQSPAKLAPSNCVTLSLSVPSKHISDDCVNTLNNEQRNHDTVFHHQFNDNINKSETTSLDTTDYIDKLSFNSSLNETFTKEDLIIASHAQIISQ